MKTKCQRFKVDNINIAFKHSIITEIIISQMKEFDDNTDRRNMVS